MRSGQSRGVAFRAAAAAVVVMMLLSAGTGTGIWLSRSGRPDRGVGANRGALVALPQATPVESAASVPTAATAGLGPFRRAWVAVPVATVWNDPHTSRPEDAGAVSPTADISRWIASLGYQQKLGLDNLLATQALLYQPLFVYGHDGDWYHVLVLDQKGAVYPWGIAGWIPAAQVSFIPPPAAETDMTVNVPVLKVGGLELSYGTALPVDAGAGGTLTVSLPTGRFAVPPGSLRPGLLPASGSAVVQQAERFLGLPYLWAGTSSFGYDCSGLTYSVFRRFGVTLARDAGDQARGGTQVAAKDLAPGDLVFFAFDGKTVDHVGIYAGNGMMVDSPHTGGAVELVPLWTGGFAPYYAGARRYL